MKSSAISLARPVAVRWHPAIGRYAPVVVIVLAIMVIWYAAAVLMNLNIVRGGFERDGTTYTTGDLIAGKLNAERPLLSARQVRPRYHQKIRRRLDACRLSSDEIALATAIRRSPAIA